MAGRWAGEARRAGDAGREDIGQGRPALPRAGRPAPGSSRPSRGTGDSIPGTQGNPLPCCRSPPAHVRTPHDPRRTHHVRPDRKERATGDGRTDATRRRRAGPPAEAVRTDPATAASRIDGPSPSPDYASGRSFCPHLLPHLCATHAFPESQPGSPSYSAATLNSKLPLAACPSCARARQYTV